jgi:hypothetical protein|tara:strand:- start:1076 stop:1222 length:147 start_codon:yes stop_codon:yes gene_type:complete
VKNAIAAAKSIFGIGMTMQAMRITEGLSLTAPTIAKDVNKINERRKYV